MITEDYVSFETAKLLKEKGFNEPCRLYYDKYHGCVPIFVEDSKLTEYGYKELVRNDQNSISDFIASAPSLYVAMKWLREVHDVQIEISIVGTDTWESPTKWMYGFRCQTKDVIDRRNADFSSYEEACENGIKYCLEKLI